MQLKEAIRAFIIDVIAVESGQNVTTIGDDESLIEAGVIDSLAILKLISYVGEELDVDLPLEDFRPEQFETLNRICTLIEAHRD